MVRCGCREFLKRKEIEKGEFFSFGLYDSFGSCLIHNWLLIVVSHAL